MQLTLNMSFKTFSSHGILRCTAGEVVVCKVQVGRLFWVFARDSDCRGLPAVATRLLSLPRSTLPHQVFKDLKQAVEEWMTKGMIMKRINPETAQEALHRRIDRPRRILC